MVAAHASRSPLAPRSLDGVGKAGARECDANSASALVGRAAGARVTGSQRRAGSGAGCGLGAQFARRLASRRPHRSRTGRAGASAREYIH